MSLATHREPVHRPGPQPFNEIGTLAEQLAIAKTPRPSRRERRRRRLLDLLEDDIIDIALAVKWGNCR